MSVEERLVRLLCFSPRWRRKWWREIIDRGFGRSHEPRRSDGLSFLWRKFSDRDEVVRKASALSGVHGQTDATGATRAARSAGRSMMQAGHSEASRKGNRQTNEIASLLARQLGKRKRYHAHANLKKAKSSKKLRGSSILLLLEGLSETRQQNTAYYERQHDNNGLSGIQRGNRLR